MSTAKPKEQIPSVAWQSDDQESRLYLGDSLQLMDSLPAESVDCIWTDPPYNLSNDGITCVAGVACEQARTKTIWFSIRLPGQLQPE